MGKLFTEILQLSKSRDLSLKTNILFVAFEFPPLSSGGMQRSLKFVKYLPAFNINPIVITVEENDYPQILGSYHLDPALKNEIPAGTVVERIHCPAVKKSNSALLSWFRIYFSVSENFKKTWRKPLEQRLPEILKKYQPAAIYVTIPPFAMVPLWLKLLKHSNIPLIIDFRDAWSQWALAPNGSYFHYLVKFRQEAAVLRKASVAITTTKQTRNDLLRLHNAVSSEKIVVIPNGYDGTIEINPSLSIPDKKRIRIGYVGSFYYSPESRNDIFKPWWKKMPHRMPNYVPRKEDWLYRSPYFFLKAIRYMLDHLSMGDFKIEIHFAGNTPSWLKEQIKEFGLDQFCFHHGYMDHSAVIAFQESCDALLLTSAKVTDGEDYSIAGKTFEYFTIGKPIIGFVCEGAQKDILEESGMSLICNPDDTEKSANAMYGLFKAEKILYPDLGKIKKYHRKNTAEQLAAEIKKAIGSV